MMLYGLFASAHGIGVTCAGQWTKTRQKKKEKRKKIATLKRSSSTDHEQPRDATRDFIKMSALSYLFFSVTLYGRLIAFEYQRAQNFPTKFCSMCFFFTAANTGAKFFHYYVTRYTSQSEKHDLHFQPERNLCNSYNYSLLSTFYFNFIILKTFKLK